jgi:Protein of unknown function (DUF664)
MTTDQETGVVLHFLGQQRHHVLGIPEGLSDEQLRQPLPPSGWNCPGMVSHLALADEHNWFPQHRRRRTARRGGGTEAAAGPTGQADPSQAYGGRPPEQPASPPGQRR